MDGVAKLEVLATEQAERFDLLETRVTVLAQDFGRIGQEVSRIGQEVSRIGQEVGRIGQEVGRLGSELDQTATQLVALAVGARESGVQLRRVARLIGVLAGDHQRLDGLEDRVEKLERKAG